MHLHGGGGKSGEMVVLLLFFFFFLFSRGKSFRRVATTLPDKSANSSFSRITSVSDQSGKLCSRECRRSNEVETEILTTPGGNYIRDCKRVTRLIINWNYVLENRRKASRSIDEMSLFLSLSLAESKINKPIGKMEPVNHRQSKKFARYFLFSFFCVNHRTNPPLNQSIENSSFE